MGCDIHAHFEIKLNSKWEHYSHPRIQRRYNLFSRIAGVRNYDEIEPISTPKGLPTDLSVTTKFCADHRGVDGHSHTWLDADEIQALMETDFIIEDRDFEHKELGYLFGNGWESWKQYPRDYPKEIEDIRFICWFDN